eukprot:Em0017g495a
MSVCSNDDEVPECPLCMEPLGLDDLNFYPCACRYQVCRFCWHRIRTDENGLCPHCREPYAENPAEYIPLTQDQMVKMKSEKKQKTIEKKQKLLESRKNLASVRVVQKNLVFVIGLSPRLADAETLKKSEYFGKYGKIYKVVINNSTVYNGAQGPSVSAYVTYHRHEDASKAIQAVNNAYIDGRYLKASFGTTKYCTFFLRGVQCTKTDCMYLHELGDEEASFTKEDMQMGKHQLYETVTLGAANNCQGETSVTMGVATVPTGVATVTVGVANVNMGVASVPGVVPNGVVPKELKRSSSHTSASRESSLCESGESNTTSLEGADSALPVTASWSTSTGVAQLSTVQPGAQTKERCSHHQREPKSKHHHNHHHNHHSKHQQQQSHKQQQSAGPASSPPPSHDDLQLLQGAKVESSAQQLNNFESDHDDQNQIVPAASPGDCGSMLGVEPSFTGNLKVSTTRQQVDLIGSRASTGSITSTPSVSPSGSLTASSSSGSVVVERGEKLEEGHVGVPKVTVITGSGSNLPGVSRPQTQQEGSGSSPVNVILGSAGTGQFGSLGVSWNCPAPEALVPSEDDLGFDPWDVSNKGLADLLEAEASNRNPVADIDEKQRLASVSYVTHGPTANGTHGPSHRVNSRGHCCHLTEKEKGCEHAPASVSWQEEFRALFPNVNISFGGSSSMGTSLKLEKTLSSLSEAVDGSRGSPFQAMHGSGFGYNMLPRSMSDGEWPDFENSQSKWTTIENASNRQQGANMPPPPPGFTAKSKASVTPGVTTQQWSGQPAAAPRPPGLNLQTTAAILQTNQLLQNWMRLQYPNLGTDFALAGQQLSRNPALYQQFQQQYLARLQQIQQQSQSLLLQGHTLLPGVTVSPSTTGQPFLGQQTLGLLGQGFYPGSSPASAGVAQPAAVQRTNSGVALNHGVHSAALN